jgi:hypothetical protein
MDFYIGTFGQTIHHDLRMLPTILKLGRAVTLGANATRIRRFHPRSIQACVVKALHVVQEEAYVGTRARAYRMSKGLSPGPMTDLTRELELTCFHR